MLLSDILCALPGDFAEALVPSLCTTRTPFRFHPFFKRELLPEQQEKNVFKCPGDRVQRALLGVRKHQFSKALQYLHQQVLWWKFKG